MITEINTLFIKEEICGETFISPHNLNLNFDSDLRRYEELESEAEVNRMLKRYGYKGTI